MKMDKPLSQWSGLIVGAACSAISVWGIWVCRSLGQQASVDAAMHSLLSILSWLVLFAPFSALGIYLLRSAFRRLRWQSLAVIPEMGEIPPGSAERQIAVAARQSNHYLDAVRMDAIAGRAARAISVVTGLFFLGLGVTGFILAWKFSHSPTVVSSLRYELANARLIGLFQLGSSLAAVLGGAILLATFKNERIV
jgi:hypothetical protein